MSFFSPQEVQFIFKEAGISSWDLRTPAALNVAVMLFQKKLAQALSLELAREGVERDVDTQHVYTLLSDLFTLAPTTEKLSSGK